MKCEMTDTCTVPATMIGEEGYIYCAVHGPRRRESGWERVRKMTPAELKKVAAGGVLERY